MHNRIYQITTSPVQPDEYLSECEFIDSSFVGSIAEFVEGGLNRVQEITMFKDLLITNLLAEFDDESCSFVIPQHGKEHLLKIQHSLFKQALRKLETLGEDDFLHQPDRVSDMIYELKSSFCNKLGDYVSSDEFDTMPFDKFVRIADAGTRYYIGGILDYRW